MATAEARTAPAGGSESPSVGNWAAKSSSSAAGYRAGETTSRRSRPHPPSDAPGFPRIRFMCRTPSRRFQPKKPKIAKKQVEARAPHMTTVASWDMADDVGYDQVNNVFQEVGEIVGIYFSSTRHLAVVDFSTEQAAENAFYHLMGYDLMGRHLNLHGLIPKTTPFADMPYPGEGIPNSVTNTVCVTGFDSSLEIGKMRHLLEGIFANKNMKKLVTPVKSDGTSTGTTTIKRYAVTACLSLKVASCVSQDGLIYLGTRTCNNDDTAVAMANQDTLHTSHSSSPSSTMATADTRTATAGGSESSSVGYWAAESSSSAPAAGYRAGETTSRRPSISRRPHSPRDARGFPLITFMCRTPSRQLQPKKPKKKTS
uniref:RRM domain-containing protein n=1 Tax=Leersia perrieri TaxID=77586 RepID=A0A0D9X830_9ORYZ